MVRKKSLWVISLASILICSGLSGIENSSAAENALAALAKLQVKGRAAKVKDMRAQFGPAWKDVAKKYKGDKTAQAKLTKEVMAGTNLYDSHWKGKVSGVAMPPNAVAIKEADAKKLVTWILSL